jgi:hypothetical protein
MAQQIQVEVEVEAHNLLVELLVLVVVKVL